MTDGEATHEEPIRLAPYDPSWPDRFAAEAALLRPALDPWLVGPIEHIGSTAVIDLTAKPVIDIMAAVRDLPSSLGARDALAFETHFARRRIWRAGTWISRSPSRGRTSGIARRTPRPRETSFRRS